MTLEENITAILETYFSGFRDELIEACAKRITEQIERQADTPQTEICDTCKYRSSNVFGNWCVGRDTCDRYEADTPQTDCGWGEVNE